MSDTAPGQPMEEILASIKRIIQDDAPSPAVHEADDSDDVLELGDPAPQAMKAASQSVVEPSSLVSGVAEAASRQAFAALSSVKIDPAADANSLDGLVRELIRPMLQQWLDQNLPVIVERLVAREVARLGGR
jgi:cell pole-organizing protein PopZ